MAIRITCPGCKSTLSLADELRGKKVRCKKCETSIKVPDAEDEEEPAKTAVASSDDDNEEEEDRPKKKKKKKAKQGISPVLIIAPVLILALVVAGGVSAYFMTRDPGPAKQVQQAKVEPKVEEQKPQQGQIFNKREDGNPGKKGGLGVVSSIRGAVYRSERKVELANINKLYNGFILETPRGQQTLENYLAYIKRDYFSVHEAIKEGYYIMNMKAQGGNDIVAGERDLDQTGHLVVFYSGDVRYVPEPEWKQAMGLK